jgi:hypothetical protein
MLATLLMNLKANSDLLKLIQNIREKEPNFFNQLEVSRVDSINRNGSMFLFVLLNNDYKKLNDPELLDRAKKVKLMLLTSLILAFLFIISLLLFSKLHA